MRKKIKVPAIMLLAAILIFSACENCKQRNLEELGLSSWKDTLKTNPEVFSIYSIIDFVNNAKQNVSEEDRIAVFDMDGTIACEYPISMETFCAYYIAYNSSPGCDTNLLTPALKKDLADSLYKKRIDVESFVDTFEARTQTIYNNCIPADKGSPRLLSKQFYKPMVELIKYLHNNDFQVYIVSGSAQPFIRGVIRTNPDSLADRKHIIGTLTKYESIHYKADSGALFFLAPVAMLSNSSIGKAQNIYDKINKTPILAFGNTVNDFDMFALTSTNTYETLCVLLNHDSDTLEAQYTPYNINDSVRKNWNQPEAPDSIWSKPIFDTIMANHKWKRMDMSKVFKKNSVFID